MTTSHSNTELDASIPEIWDMKVEEARYYYGDVMSRVSSKSGLVKEKGDKINVTIDKKLTTGTVGTSGAFTLTSRTPDTVQLTVDTWIYTGVDVDDRAKMQSFWSPESSFPSDAGKAFSAEYDKALLALYTDLTGGSIYTETAPKAFGNDAAREALLLFADTDKPMEDIFFIVPPSGIFRGILNERAFTDVGQAGLSGKSPLISGDYKMPIVGAPIVMSNLCATAAGGSNTRKALLLHKSAFAIAMQYNNNYRKYDAAPAGRLAYGIVGESLYGVKTIRADHGVIINTI